MLNVSLRQRVVCSALFVTIIHVFFICIFFSSSIEASEFKIPYLDKPPLIDGKISDGEWKGAFHIDKFYQISPGDNISPTERTVLQIGYDSKCIYFCFQCFVNKKQSARYFHVRRDGDIFSGDCVSLYIDTFLKYRDVYSITVSALGDVFDGVSNGCSFDTNKDLDIDFTARGKVYPNMYIVEIKIPFKSINFDKRNMKWGIIALRRCPGLNGEVDSQTKIDRKQDCVFTQEEKIIFPTSIGASKLQMILEAAGHYEHTSVDNFGTNTTNSYNVGSVGGTLLWKFRSNQTINLTVNPDFSNVEADDIRLIANNRFPLYYPEKRPFFLENTTQFPFLIDLYYSRTIVDPAAGLVYSSRIGKSSFFAMFAQENNTPSERFGFNENISGTTRWLIGRYSYQYKEDSKFGLFYSSRFWNGKYNEVFDMDGKHRFSKSDTLSWQWAISNNSDNVRGNNGSAWSMVYHHSSQPLYFWVSNEGISPDFDADSGFIRRKNYVSTEAGVGLDFKTKKNKSLITDFNTNVFYSIYYDFDGNLTDRYTGLDSVLYTKGQNAMRFDYNRSYVVYGDIPFRTHYFYFAISNYRLKWLYTTFYYLQGTDILYYIFDPQMGNSRVLGANVNIKMGKKLRLEERFDYDALKRRDIKNKYLYKFYSTETKLYYFLTPHIWARIMWIWYKNRSPFYQYRVRNNFLNCMIAYQPKAHTAFYLGYNNGVDNNLYWQWGGYRTKDHILFVKIDYQLDVF